MDDFCRGVCVEGSDRGKMNGASEPRDVIFPRDGSEWHLVKITVKYVDEEPIEYVFNQDRIFFGTAEECDIRLRTALASRLQAELLQAGGQWLVRSLNPSECLLVNGNQADRITFPREQSFHIGDIAIHVVDETVPLEEFMLVPAEPGLPLKPISLIQDQTLIGRSEDSDLIINERSVSRHHAVVERDALGSGWLVRDLGSHNGTFVNDIRVQKEEIRPGDRIRFGRILVHFEGRVPNRSGKTMILQTPSTPEDRSSLSKAAGTERFSSPDVFLRREQMPPRSNPRPIPRKKSHGNVSATSHHDQIVFVSLLGIVTILLLSFLGLMFLFRKAKDATAPPPEREIAFPRQTNTPQERSFSPKDEPPARVEVARVRTRRSETNQEITLKGTVRPAETWHVLSPWQGKIDRILPKEGAIVTQGDLLAKVDLSDTRRVFEAKKATLNRMDMEIANDRLQKMKQDRLSEKVTDEQVEQAQRAYDLTMDRYRSDLAQLAELEESLRNDSLFAPQAGRVLQIHAQPQQRIFQGQPLFTFRSLEPAIVDANVDDVLGKRCEQGISVTAADTRGHVFSGQFLTHLWLGQQMVLKISLEDKEGRLTEGDSVSITLKPGKSGPSLWIPARAVLTDKGENYVFILEDGQAILCWVYMGQTSGEWMEVLDGLSDQDQVLVVFPEDLQEGQRIYPVPHPLDGT